MSTLKRSGIQLATPFSESRLMNTGRYHTHWKPPYIIQPKLNGERCRAIVADSRCLLLSSTEQIISTVPAVNASMLMLPDGEYDGELYVHGMTFSQIHSVVSTQSIHPGADYMQYHIFDLILDNTLQVDRYAKLLEIEKWPRTANIQFVKTYVAFTYTEIMSYYDQFISEGYEGFILREISSPYVRKRSGQMMKFKGAKKDCYRIVRIHEAISENGIPLKMLGAFECIDEMGTMFKVGAGKLTHSERITLYNIYLNDSDFITSKYLEVEYQVLSDKNNVPLFSRAIKLIEEYINYD